MTYTAHLNIDVDGVPESSIQVRTATPHTALTTILRGLCEQAAAGRVVDVTVTLRPAQVAQLAHPAGDEFAPAAV